MKNIDEFQQRITSYGRPSTLEYALIAFGGEAGEVLNEHKKAMREVNLESYSIDEENHPRKGALVEEMSDCAYYLAHICKHLGVQLSDVLQAGIDKMEKKYGNVPTS